MVTYDQQTGGANIRTEIVDGVIRGLTPRLYKFMQALTVAASNARTNTFFQEDPTVLSGSAQNGIEDVPRGAQAATVNAQWVRQSSITRQYQAEAWIAWADLLMDDVDVLDRNSYKVAEAIAKAIDDRIYATLMDQTSLITASGAAPVLTFSNINSVTTPVTSGNIRQWQDTSASIVSNLLEAARKMAENNYDVTGLQAYMTPANYQYLMTYLGEKGAQWNSVGNNIATNGKVQNVAGIDIIVSNSCAASYVLVVKPQIVGAWKEVMALTSNVETKENVFKIIRSTAYGVPQLWAPKAATVIQTTF